MQASLVHLDRPVGRGGLPMELPGAVGVGHRVIRAVEDEKRHCQTTQVLLQVGSDTKDFVARSHPYGAREHQRI